MDFQQYAEAAAALLNADLPDVDALVEHLHERQRLHPFVVEEDVAALHAFCAELRPVFVASDAGDAPTVVGTLNELLAKHPVTPMITGHDSDKLHLHVADQASSVAELLISESLMGLANLVCDLGAGRLGLCRAEKCDHVFVDTSPNESRRYCSERCSSRANVAAYRARQRAAAG
ncbi:CGNR zinc finger domain-containing protein [Nocardioides piscis]|uniref:Zinc finger CGNR domain-containing protein n=1 Tax=Nocardioides piscis TaxID=2714938 RepID=A0A6G7YEY5_9ACTN|nr:CGNR zinc finger domain-containing protein [Nocardioides piscis]QIK75353.1 hypothetical protein G7071_07815 [Nocardioides piscis]